MKSAVQVQSKQAVANCQFHFTIRLFLQNFTEPTTTSGAIMSIALNTAQGKLCSTENKKGSAVLLLNIYTGFTMTLLFHCFSSTVKPRG